MMQWKPSSRGQEVHRKQTAPSNHRVVSGEHLAYRKKGRWKKDLATAWPFTGPNQNLWRGESRESLLQPDAPP